MNNTSNTSHPILDVSHHVGETVSSVAGMGATLGLVYVFTSADHLTAIVSSAPGNWLRSSLHGLRWGCVHAVGVLLIFLCILSLPDYDLDSVGPGLDAVVGFVSMSFGLYGIWSARVKYIRHLKKYRKTSSNSNSETEELKCLSPSRQSLMQEFDQIDIVRHTDQLETKQNPQNNISQDISCPVPCIVGEEACESEPIPAAPVAESIPQVVSRSDSQAEPAIKTPPVNETCTQDTFIQDAGSCEECQEQLIESSGDLRQPLVDEVDRQDPPGRQTLARYSHLLVALFYGLFDGFAGVSAVLAVIPTVAMRHHPAKSAAYMGMFFLTSLTTVSILAGIWSFAARRISWVIWFEFVFTACASAVTVILGIIWEVLLALDLLDVVFE